MNIKKATDRLVVLVVCANVFAATFAYAGAETNTAANAIVQETPAQRDVRMQWWRDARFGMFIHWGLYSVPAGEWQEKTNYGEWILEETHMPVSGYEKYAA